MEFVMKSFVVATGLLVLVGIAPAHAATQAREVFEAMGFSEADLAKGAAGQIVTTPVKATSERELSVAMGFKVKAPTDELMKELQGGLLLRVDENAKAHGVFEGQGSLADFAGLKLGADELAAYADARPGGDLNFSTTEIAAFRKAGKAGAEQALKEALLGRLRAYQTKGLAGLAPYDRGDGKSSPVAQDLANASKQATLAQKLAPAFYRALVGYPAGKQGLEERFQWTHYEAHGSPVVILTHGFSMKTADFYVVCQRQFYVTSSYNAEQAIAGLFPVEGGTAVAYVNRTFTDQVTGFGGSQKRSIGSKVLSGQLQDLFTKFSDVAAK
jgi:hypothetical protein